MGLKKKKDNVLYVILRLHPHKWQMTTQGNIQQDFSNMDHICCKWEPMRKQRLKVVVTTCKRVVACNKVSLKSTNQGTWSTQQIFWNISLGTFYPGTLFWTNKWNISKPSTHLFVVFLSCTASEHNTRKWTWLYYWTALAKKFYQSRALVTRST